MLFVLKDHPQLSWREQAIKFLEKLVGFDCGSQGPNRGECSQSQYLQDCHALLESGKGKDKSEFFFSCGKKKIGACEFPIVDWDTSPVECPYQNDENRFKICNFEHLQILIDWDCLLLKHSVRKNCSVYASGGGKKRGGESSQSETQSESGSADEEDYEHLWSMPSKDGDLVQKIPGADEVYQLRQNIQVSELSIQKLSGWAASKKKNNISNASSPSNPKDADYQYLALRYPVKPITDVHRETIDVLELSENGLQLQHSAPNFSCQKLYGTDRNSWPKIRVPDFKKATDFFVLQNDGKVQGARDSQRGKVKNWVFTPTYQHHLQSDRKALLNRTDALKPAYATDLTQVLVVRSGEEFDAYSRDYGQWYIIVTLPKIMYLSKESLPNFRGSQFKLQQHNLKGGKLAVTPDSGGIAYARLFVQTFAGFLGLENVWLLDDNVHSCYELDLDAMYAESPVTHKPLLRCPFSKVMAEIEGMLESESVAVSDEYKTEQNDLNTSSTPSNPSQKCPSVILGGIEIQAPRRPGADPRARTNARTEMSKRGQQYAPVQTFRDYSGGKNSYGVIGIHRVPNMHLKVQSPFKITHSAYSFYLLNVKETIRLGVYYAIHDPWEDIEFNQLCEEAGLAVLKCNRFFHKKLNLQPHGGGKTCKPKPRQVEIKISISGQKDLIHFEVDEGSSDCKSVWPRVCKEVKKHLRQDTNSNPIVFQAHGLRTIGADSVVRKKFLLDLDAGEKLQEDLMDDFLEYEVQVIYELSGDKVFSEAFGSVDDCEH